MIFYRYQVKRGKEVKLVAARCSFEAKAQAALLLFSCGSTVEVQATRLWPILRSTPEVVSPAHLLTLWHAAHQDGWEPKAKQAAPLSEIEKVINDTEQTAE